MPKLAIGHIEYNSVINIFPVGIAWQKHKLRVRIDQFPDKPWAGDSIYFNFLAGDPFHKLAFIRFQRGGPLSAVPAILAGGAAMMAIAGILFFRETLSWQRLLGIAFAILGLFLLRR